MDDSAPTSRAVRRGRTIGTATLGILISTFTAVCSAQIIQQAWTPPGSTTTVTGSCRDDALGLIRAIRRAREVAAASTEGERAAVVAFRRTLDPEWSGRASISTECRGDQSVRLALPEIDRLRYAEEHALRYEALDVANRRLRVEGIAERLRAEP